MKPANTIKQSADLPIIISGAGVAGMVAALFLAQQGRKVEIYEKVKQLKEVGAGLQLAPNATMLLDRLGLIPALETYAVKPDILNLRDGATAQTLVSMNLHHQPHQWAAPWLVIHRADLQNVLHQAIEAHPLISLTLGHEIIGYESDNNLVHCQIRAVAQEDEGALNNSAPQNATDNVGQATILTRTTPLLLGCDGVWSKLRRFNTDPNQTLYSGFSAWRISANMADLDRDFAALLGKPEAVNAFMGKNAHLVAYPLRSGTMLNCVAIINAPAIDKQGAKHVENHDLLKAFGAWHPTIVKFLQDSHDITYWPLYQSKQITYIAAPNVVLLGDAAHAVTPFAAQGAAMAIEDAAALAAVFADTPPQALQEMPNAQKAQKLQLFSDNRLQRLEKVAKRGDFNRFVYHASGPMAWGRNMVMRLRPSDGFLASLDWLYKYDATQFAAPK